MQFDPNNPVIKLCAEGMEQEGAGSAEKAKALFTKAWNKAKTPFEKCISAHYLARHQDSVIAKLEWDERALGFAKEVSGEEIKSMYPSLYLNIGKCFEDLNNAQKAKENYHQAFAQSTVLPSEGYGKMIKEAIMAGLKRVS
jgi:hypothetical protein